MSVAHVVAVTYTSVLFFVSVPMGRFLAFGGYDIFCVQEHRYYWILLHLILRGFEFYFYGLCGISESPSCLHVLLTLVCCAVILHPPKADSLL